MLRCSAGRFSVPRHCSRPAGLLTWKGTRTVSAGDLGIQVTPTGLVLSLRRKFSELKHWGRSRKPQILAEGYLHGKSRCEIKRLEEKHCQKKKKGQSKELLWQRPVARRRTTRLQIMALSTVSCGRALNWKAVTVRSLVKAAWWVGHGVGTPD